MSLRDELLETELEFWEADPSFHHEHYHERFVAVLGDDILDHEASVASVEPVPPLTGLQVRDVTFHRPTPDCAVLAYRVTAERSGRDAYGALVGSVYVRDEGRWLQVFHQHTPASS